MYVVSTLHADKPKLAINLLSPTEASGAVHDSTTMLVLYHAFRMGCGGITVRNLFAMLNDIDLKKAQLDGEETASAEKQKSPSCEYNHPAP